MTHLLPSAPAADNAAAHKQRKMMVIALVLLLAALGIVIYRDRDFWFADTEQADVEEQPTQQVQSEVRPNTVVAPPTGVAKSAPMIHKKGRVAKSRSKASVRAEAPAAAASAASAQTDGSAASSAAPVTAVRTVLPPLEVEVVAGDVHKTIHPGTSAVRVNLQPGSPQAASSQQLGSTQSDSVSREVAAPSATDVSDEAARMTSNAAERVQMSADTAEVVGRPVKPSYPLLARQMKVQGSVILQALIGRDGFIQDLHVLSGPPILAGAAEEAVKQWHFRPHFQGVEKVETQARITVNFTISTN